VAAECGHLQLAYDYLGEAALMDLDDLEHNTGDGVHIAALAGSWLAIACGLGGMRHHENGIIFAPRRPETVPRFLFNVLFQGRSLRVEVRGQEAGYLLRSGKDLQIEHHGQPVTLTEGNEVVLPLPETTPMQAPTQPHGRAPASRVPVPFIH
jgi:alpha,alpha-trehalose phosphorylase